MRLEKTNIEGINLFERYRRRKKKKKWSDNNVGAQIFILRNGRKYVFEPKIYD